MQEMKGEYFCGNIANFSGKKSPSFQKRKRNPFFLSHFGLSFDFSS
jgi:hypothetical protein